MASDTSNLLFDYELFRSLNGSDLVEYMETLLSDTSIKAPGGTLIQLASDAPSYDEYHAVYALELGMQRAPEVFVSLAAKLLCHESQPVRFAAHRGLLNLPASLLTIELIDNCQQALDSSNFADVLDIIDKLHRRQRSF